MVKRCKVTGCTNARGGHAHIWKGLCSEHAAAAERLGHAERSRWFARHVVLGSLLGVWLLGCAGHSTTDPEPGECIEIEWTSDWCAARPAPQTVFVGCAVPPRGSCAPAELSTEKDAYCCW
jgi:hypothetical protein